MILRILLEEKWEKVATEVENDNCRLAELGSLWNIRVDTSQRLIERCRAQKIWVDPDGLTAVSMKGHGGKSHGND